WAGRYRGWRPGGWGTSARDRSASTPRWRGWRDRRCRAPRTRDHRARCVPLLLLPAARSRAAGRLTPWGRPLDATSPIARASRATPLARVGSSIAAQDSATCSPPPPSAKKPSPRVRATPAARAPPCPPSRSAPCASAHRPPKTERWEARRSNAVGKRAAVALRAQVTAGEVDPCIDDAYEYDGFPVTATGGVFIPVADGPTGAKLDYVRMGTAWLAY